MQTTSRSVQLQTHYPTLPSSNFGQVVSTKIPKYSTYLSFVFTSTSNEEDLDAVCLLFNKILTNSSIAPAKLLRHLEKKSPNRQRQRYFLKKTTDNQKIKEASYKLPYRIVLEGEADVFGESPVKPCVQHFVSRVLGERYRKQVESVSLSSNTVKRHINNIADDF
ncbi:zinc finger BED domain-containing protein 5 [Trichonephila inaurata madagascariensis]|uniref:Zinc finger BED domain-containing protein 5 n=1 Tax=Trichonephila inaurata madagascariensis TaxID=2747483 RepID=A0A8X6Y079_9ARAC|nr:zinc finger BED domain-containing protein 5 [Trichonephila inaurata madagascariensis]